MTTVVLIAELAQLLEPSRGHLGGSNVRGGLARLRRQAGGGQCRRRDRYAGRVACERNTWTMDKSEAELASALEVIEADHADMDQLVQGALGTIPHVGPFLASIAAVEVRRYDARMRETAIRALGDVEVGRVQAVFEDERRARLFAQAIMRAAFIDWPERRAALGGALRSALLGDDAELDDSDLIVDALMDIDRPHVSLLQRMNATAEPKLPQEIEGGAHPSAIAGLQRHGAIIDCGIDGGDASGQGGGTLWCITEFGRTLLNLIDEATVD